MRYLILTVSFFAVQGIVFALYGDSILQRLALVYPASVHSPLQKGALEVVRKLHRYNTNGVRKTYVVGASYAVSFSHSVETLSPRVRGEIVSLATGSQVLPDAIRLIENIDVPGSTVVLVISPHKFANMWFERSMIESHYLNGVAAKLWLPSEEFEELWRRFAQGRHIADMVWTKSHWRIYSPLMPLAYGLSDIASESSRRMVQAMKRASARAPVAPDTPAQRSKPLVRKSPHSRIGHYLDDISEFKLEQFRTWRDFSLRQFDESVRESFRMLHYLIDLAHSKGLNVVVAEAPVPEIEDHELLPYIPGYQRSLDALAARGAGVRVLRFDRARYPNPQANFADYVHVNRAGEAFYRAYLHAAFEHLTDPDKAFPEPRISLARGRTLAADWTYDDESERDDEWSDGNVLRLAPDVMIRQELIDSSDAPLHAFGPKSEATEQLSLSRTAVNYRLFVDSFGAEGSPAIRLSTQESGSSVTFPLTFAGGRPTDYLRAEIHSPWSSFVRLSFVWPRNSMGQHPPLRRWLNLFPTPFIWAFPPSAQSEISGRYSTPWYQIAPGDAWTVVEHIPVPRFAGTGRLVKPAGKHSLKLFLTPTSRHYSRIPLGVRLDTSGATATFELPAIDRRSTRGKIANYGIEFELDEIAQVFYVEGDHTVTRSGDSHERRLGSFSPHVIGLKRVDNTFRTLSIAGADLVDVTYSSKTRRLLLSVAFYHAHERFTNGYDLTPAQVAMRGGRLDFRRQYRNLAVTDIVGAGSVSLSMAREPQFVFPLWQPGSRRASLVLVEHADYQEEDTDPMVMYGNDEKVVRSGEGFLGNRIPMTKTIFLGGEPERFPMVVHGTTVPMEQPTLTANPGFAADIGAYHRSGLIEIAAHQAGTAPYANLQEAAGMSLKRLRDEFDGRVWTDHGAIPSNLSFNGWDPRNAQYYVVDDLVEQQIDYAWTGPDDSPHCVVDGVLGRTLESAHEERTAPPCGISMIQRGAADRILFDLPMLSVNSTEERRPMLFASTEFSYDQQHLDALVAHRGAAILHAYFGQAALRYSMVGGVKTVTLKPEHNRWLRKVAELRDEGSLYVATLSDWLDYVRAIRELKLSRSGGVTWVDNPSEPISAVSFAEIDYSEPLGSRVLPSGTERDPSLTGRVPVRYRAPSRYFHQDLATGINELELRSSVNVDSRDAARPERSRGPRALVGPAADGVPNRGVGGHMVSADRSVSPKEPSAWSRAM